MKLVILLSLLLFSFISKGQNLLESNPKENKIELSIPTNTDRYNLDFRVIEWNEINQEVIDLINLKDLEKSRSENEDLQFHIAELNITVELFSIVKTLDNAEKSKLKIDYFHNKYFTIISE